MTEREIIASLLEGLRRCAFCKQPATVRGHTASSNGLPACDTHAPRLQGCRDLPWAGAVRAAMAPGKPIGGHEFEGEMKAQRAALAFVMGWELPPLGAGPPGEQNGTT